MPICGKAERRKGLKNILNSKDRDHGKTTGTYSQAQISLSFPSVRIFSSPAHDSLFRPVRKKPATELTATK